MDTLFGVLGERLTARTVVLAAVVALAVFAFLGHRRWQDTSVECVRCHSDREKVTELGAPWAFVTEEAVRKESRHAHILCRDCHLGNGRARDKEAAHRGMLKMLLVSGTGEVVGRSRNYPYGLSRTGPEEIFAFLPKARGEDGWRFYPVRNILWHDRDPGTFNFDPDLAAKTCGKSGCHPAELRQFLKTPMGTNMRQRTMKTWREPYGPHNCGPSFADLPPGDVLRGAGFSFRNTEEIAKELNVPFTGKQAAAKQKFCNVCHTGCLDCHFQPGRERGTHHFSKRPVSESCAGFGRGTSVCHAGAMQSRRGGTYIGGDYSVPAGMAPDTHYREGFQCTDCHLTGERGMGDMERKADCRDCHQEVEEALAKSAHRNLSCAACHLGEVRGYQITVWGPGIVAGERNPFHKYLYYGTQKPPLLMKDRGGVWQPMKVWPHSVGNIKPEVPPSARLLYRWPKGESEDAYYVVGTVAAGANGNQLLWLEAERVSHPYGRARACASCHEREEQTVVSGWEFMDDQGAEPFRGSYRIVADGEGLRIGEMKTESPIRVAEGYTADDFAPWLRFRDVWRMPGDFAIRADSVKYREALRLFRQVRRETDALRACLKQTDAGKERRYRTFRGAVLHHPGGKEEGMRELSSLCGRE